jgi:hypothetical protein
MKLKIILRLALVLGGILDGCSTKPAATVAPMRTADARLLTYMRYKQEGGQNSINYLVNCDTNSIHCLWLLHPACGFRPRGLSV